MIVVHANSHRACLLEAYVLPKAYNQLNKAEKGHTYAMHTQLPSDTYTVPTPVATTLKVQPLLKYFFLIIILNTFFQ